MRSGQRVWIVGAATGAIFAALVIALLVALGSVLGSAMGPIGELVGLGFVLGPAWLGPAVAGASILAAGLIGGRAARRSSDNLLVEAMVGLLWVVVAYVAWVFVWSALRLGVSGEIRSAPFFPLYAAFLAFAGLLVPAIVLFLPASLLWVWVVGALLGDPSSQRPER